MLLLLLAACQHLRDYGKRVYTGTGQHASAAAPRLALQTGSPAHAVGSRVAYTAVEGAVLAGSHQSKVDRPGHSQQQATETSGTAGSQPTEALTSSAGVALPGYLVLQLQS